MAVHADPLVASFFGRASVIDFEYERVGIGHAYKEIEGRKVSPDLVIHERGNRRGNHLVIEVKPLGHSKGRAWGLYGPALKDYQKLHFLTNHLERRRFDSSQSYAWGLYLELDTHGGNLWWIPRRSNNTLCVTDRLNCGFMQAPRAPFVAFCERWTAP